MSTKTSIHALSVLLALSGVVLGIFIAQYLPPDWLDFRGESPPQADEEVQEDGQLWTCGMHPHVLEEEPGQCPICGMNLTPVRDPMDSHAGHDHATEMGGTTQNSHANEMGGSSQNNNHMHGTDNETMVSETGGTPGGGRSPEMGGTPGGTVVAIDPTVVQNMNVRMEPALRRDLTRPIRTVGYLEFDQQRMVTVTTKYSGWVEKVNVNYVGEEVRRGQPLFEIYSPELVQTEQELLSALEFAREMESAPEDARQRAESLVESARTRLGYWDVTPQQIARLEETAEVFRTLEVSAPAGGLVMKRLPGLEGMAVQPGMELFHIADLSSLWLSVEIFEDQLAAVREGTPAEITLSYFPGETFRGRVRFLEPELAEKTRTMRAKIEVPNRGGRLRKGMYATVELRPVEVRDALTVPLQAVLRTGQRNVVLEALGNGRFVPREVALGHEAEGFAEVRHGLEEGVQVVTSAQFLLDSESSLREAIQKMVRNRRGAAEESASEPVTNPTDPQPADPHSADPHAAHQHTMAGHGAH